MSFAQNKTGGTAENQQIRHSLVDTAVNFLLNPAVINKPYAHKTAFLKNKGLSDAEISLAYKKAEKDPKFKKPQGYQFSERPVLPLVPVYRSPSFWSRLNDISSSLTILGVALFGAHYVYKKFIEPLIFGPASGSKKSFHLEKKLLEITHLLSQIQGNISTLQSSMKGQKKKMNKFLKEQDSKDNPSSVLLKEMRTEITTIKGILVNRHQFPACRTVSPTIPGLQLSAKSSADDKTEENAKMDDHNAQNISKDSSNSEMNTVMEHNVDAASKSSVTVDLESRVSTKPIRKLFSEELNESPMPETISSVTKSSEKLKNFPIPDAIINA